MDTVGLDITCPMCKGNNWKIVYIALSQVIKCHLCSYQAEYMFRENRWNVVSYGTLKKDTKDV